MPIRRTPRLTRCQHEGVCWWTDEELGREGIVVAFSERAGGVSAAPFHSLNLAGHVGDDPGLVDVNRGLLLAALGLSSFAQGLTTAEQVHSANVTLIRSGGAGARAGGVPVAQTDALVTTTAGVPLLMCFADCVPVILVAPGPAVAVVHAGRRGILSGVVAASVAALVAESSADASEIAAYVGPHIYGDHYCVTPEMLSQFVEVFGTFARAESGGLDLGSVVTANLTDAGVQSCHIASLGRCTTEETDRFFSYRAESGLTGRHGALACIVPSSS